MQDTNKDLIDGALPESKEIENEKNVDDNGASSLDASLLTVYPERSIQSDEDEEDAENIPFGFWRVFKHISSLSLPMALSFTFSFEMFLIVILLNHLNENEDEIAATTLITALMNLLAVIGMSPLFAMSVVASNKIGELTEAEKNGVDEVELKEKRDAIASINRNGLLLSMGLTVPVTLGLVFSKPILTNIFGQDENVAQIAQNYLRVNSIAVAGLFARVSSEQMMFSFGRATPAMLLGLANLGIGTGLATWLGFGGAGVPKLGPTGVALGFVVESYLTSLSYALYLAKHKDFTKFHFFDLLKKTEGRLKQLKEILTISKSITFSVASEMIMSLVTGVLAGLVGTREQSAMTFVNQFVYFNFIALAGFGQGCSQEVNRQIGAKKYENASRIGSYGLLTSMIYTTPIPLLFAIAPNLLMASNSSNSDVKDILKYLVPITSIGAIADSGRYGMLQQLRPLGDLRGSTILSVSGLSLGMATAAILGLKTPAGIYGVAAGNSGWIILTTAGLAYRWKNRISAEKIKQNIESPAKEISITKCISTLFSCPARAKNQKVIEKDEKKCFVTPSKSYSVLSHS